MKAARRRMSGDGDLEKELKRPVGARWLPGCDEVASPGAVETARFDSAGGEAIRDGGFEAIECHLRGSARITADVGMGRDLSPPLICTRHWRQVYFEAIVAAFLVSTGLGGDEL
jgi:hypothetical protein